MRAHFFRRTGALLATLLVLFGGTAKEALHAFAPAHEDTEHRHTDGLSFEQEHHHCSALSAFLSPFAETDQPFFLQCYEARYTPLRSVSAASLLPRRAPARGLRGPPAA